MPWSQDVMIFILFPFLLPSFPFLQNDCWPKQKFRSVLTYLLKFLCKTHSKEVQEVLKSFVKKTLLVSSDEISLDTDILFLAAIEERSSVDRLKNMTSDTHLFYACVFLIENKADLHINHDLLFWSATARGYKSSVSLLLDHKANVHALNDVAIQIASRNGHYHIVALLLEHKANVHARDDLALRSASENAHKDIVALLLEHKASF
jgi:hypothetical protein